MPITGIRSIQGETIISKSPKEVNKIIHLLNIKVYDFISNLENKPKYDKNYDCGYIIKKIDEHYSIIYNKYKGKFLFAARDMVLVTKKEFVYINDYNNYN